jgi:hypothetical protein
MRSAPLLLFACTAALAAGSACTGAQAHEVAAPEEPQGDALFPTAPSRAGAGDACASHEECGQGAVCLSEGFPGGLCSSACLEVCPAGAAGDAGPEPLCADTAQLQGDALVLGAGACLPACDYGRFGGGCREGYGCVPLEQQGAPGSIRYACMPGVETPLDGALAELALARVPFSPVTSADESPPGRPDLRCRVEDGVQLHSPVAGVDLRYFAGDEGEGVLASAELALALAQTLGELKELGVTALVHMGTYNCRTLRGRAQLSRHGHAAAIDVFGFELGDGGSVSVKKDWRREAKTKSARLLQEIIDRLVASKRWSVVLTPAYDEPHHDHLHLEVLPRETDVAALFRRWPRGKGD